MSDMNDFIIKNGVLTKYTGKDAEVLLPKEVHTIGKYAFEAANTLVSIDIPKTVKAIEFRAFRNCAELKSVHISSSVQSFGNDIFDYCDSLVSFISDGALPANVCLSLTRCYNLRILYAPKTPLEFFKKVANKHITLQAVTGYLVYGDKKYSAAEKKEYQLLIKQHWKKLLPNLFEGDLAEAVEICVNLRKPSVREFEADFFKPAQDAGAKLCVALLMDWKSKNISPKAIEKETILEVQRDPFNTTDMRKVWTFRALEDGTIAISGYKGTQTDLILPERIGSKVVTRIDDNAFCPFKAGRSYKNGEVFQKIETVKIPDSVTTIGDHAFKGCRSLISIRTPSSLKELGAGAFEECTKLLSIEIPAGVCEIGDCTFKNCWHLNSLILHGSILSIGKEAFYGCKNLSNMDISEGVLRIGKGTFYGCVGITNIVLPTSLTFIDDQAFAGCSNLTEINIPSRVAHIGQAAFWGCEKISCINIPEGVEKLLNNVFDGCKNIACVIIPKTLGKVCDSVFANCDSLSKIYYNGSSSDFKNIEVTSPYSRTGNASFTKATKYFYSAKRPTEEGNFWYHFGDELAEW